MWVFLIVPNGNHAIAELSKVRTEMLATFQSFDHFQDDTRKALQLYDSYFVAVALYVEVGRSGGDGQWREWREIGCFPGPFCPTWPQ